MRRHREETINIASNTRITTLRLVLLIYWYTGTSMSRQNRDLQAADLSCMKIVAISAIVAIPQKLKKG